MGAPGRHREPRSSSRTSPTDRASHVRSRGPSHLAMCAPRRSRRRICRHRLPRPHRSDNATRLDLHRRLDRTDPARHRQLVSDVRRGDDRDLLRSGCRVTGRSIDRACALPSSPARAGVGPGRRDRSERRRIGSRFVRRHLRHPRHVRRCVRRVPRRTWCQRLRTIDVAAGTRPAHLAHRPQHTRVGPGRPRS